MVSIFGSVGLEKGRVLERVEKLVLAAMVFLRLYASYKRKGYRMH